MLNMLIQFVFGLINKVVSILFAPLFLVLNVFTPFGSYFTQIFSAITTFVNIALNYFNFFVDLLCIPPVLLQIVFGVGLAIFTWNIGVRALMLAVAIYRAFKP